jgi:hypothetical protein
VVMHRDAVAVRGGVEVRTSCPTAIELPNPQTV